MKLLRLEILNLASLDNPNGEVIDFTEGALGGSTIFSIVGPTGSGKSTLLDAICLALYNRAPRYPRERNERKTITIYGNSDQEEKNRPSPTDGRNILTRGKNVGYSKLTFVANDGTTYRAEWHVKYNRTRYNDPVKLLFKVGSSLGKKLHEESAEWDQLPQIIGLDYEQFLRTVLIAQGSFAHFLTANEKSRFELLEKLIGCEDLYKRIAAGIHAQYLESVTSLNRVNDSIDTIKQNLIEDAELSALKDEIALLEQKEKALNDDLLKVKEQLKWFIDENNMLDDIASKQSKAEQAMASLKAFSESSHRLSLHDALNDAVDVLREVKRLTHEQSKLKDVLKANEVKVQSQEIAIETEKKAFAHLKQTAEEASKAFNDAIPHIRKARAILTQMQGAQETLAERATAKSDAEQEKTAAAQALKDNQDEIKRNEQTVALAEEQLSQKASKIEQECISLSEQVKLIEDLLQGLSSRVKELNADKLSQSKSAADKSLQELHQAIEVVDNLGKCETERCQCNTLSEDAERLIKQARTELSRLTIDALDKEVTHKKEIYTLMSSEKWENHRHLLSDGTPCPLCGATSHPFSRDLEQLSHTTMIAREHITSLENELKRQRAVEREQLGIIKHNEALIETYGKRIIQLEGDIEKYQSLWDTLHEQHPSWPMDKTTLQAMRPELEQKQRTADDELRTFNRVQAEITEQNSQKDQAIKTLDRINRDGQQSIQDAQNKVNECKTALTKSLALTARLIQSANEKTLALDKTNEAWQNACDTLNRLNEQFRQELGGEHPDTVEQRLSTHLQEAEKSMKQKSDQITELDSKLSNLKGALETQGQQLLELQKERMDQMARLDNQISIYNARQDRLCEVSQATIAELLSSSDNWEALRKQKEMIAHSVSTTDALLNQAQKAHEKHQETKPEQTQEQLHEQETLLKQNSQQEKLIEDKTRLSNHDKAKKALGERAEALRQAQQLHDDWKAIYDSIGNKDGDTVRKIAQCYTLGFLIEHANAEIQKFNSRYELQQVRNSLGIRVIDHDRADDVRDTTSLSGGETFIISLGLALGLSSLSSRNISCDNLFIDEGFGTLDADTLATVIDSLAMLQTSQGKKVGVISHTDTMSERITTQIRVVPNGSGSSHIEIHPQSTPISNS